MKDTRYKPVEMTPDEFRAAGHALTDRIAAFLEQLPAKPVTTGERPSEIQNRIGRRSLPLEGEDAGSLLSKAAELLCEHSLLNGHPRFLGYITSSAAPIGALGDMLAASVNPNVGAWNLSPVASEIERQTVSWIAEMLRYDPKTGGLLVSGGNMANFVCFLAARTARAPWDVRREGFSPAGKPRLIVYASSETHTWIEKAADMFGLGTNQIRWIETDAELRMRAEALQSQIRRDREAGDHPLLVVGTAGSVSTGAIDPLAEIGEICKAEDLWFHIDGAYGALAAALPEPPGDLGSLGIADSVAVDPHKWLYAPLEAGCAIVRDAAALNAAFTYMPSYYKFDDVAGEAMLNYSQFGPQNSRGFRALKVWLCLQQAGLEGYRRMIADEIELAKMLFDRTDAHEEFEAVTHNLSIATFRYVPAGLNLADNARESYLNSLNTEILTRLQEGGEAFVSNAMVHGKYVLRGCVVNFRTTAADIEAIPEIIARIGRSVHANMSAEHGPAANV